MLGIFALHACLLLSQSVEAAAQDEAYELQPGDELSVTYLGLQPAPHVSAIGIDGTISFPFLGTLQARGLTLPELEIEIGRAAVGVEVPNLIGREPAFVVLNEYDLFLEVVRFRPLTISGSVVSPGRVEFAPGMTVRSAIGASGGLATGANGAGGEAPAQLTAALRLGQLIQARKIKNAVLLANPSSVETVSEANLAALNTLLGEADAAMMRDDIRLAIEDRRNADKAFGARIELVDERIARLRTALQNYTTASVSEEDRLARILHMLDRGLTTAERVNATRLAALTASTRLLTIEGDLFATQAERERLVSEMEQAKNAYRSDLLAERQALDQELLQLQGRIGGLEAFLLATESMTDLPFTTQTEVVLYRGVGEDEKRMVVPMGELVQPGDIIDIQVMFLER